MKLVKTSLLSAILATGLVSGAAIAQEKSTNKSQAPAMKQQQAPQIEVSEKQVDDFVDAYVAVQTIGQQYKAKIQGAGDKAKAQELQQQARGEMKSAITDTGLDLDEYKQIAMAANQDESLRNRISTAINEVVQAKRAEQTGS
ncbi:DUF4168 domain-containing protein [Alteromonas halophila]|uniref:DUF4168 domain-containing protein n=1 Tax=Alteromonas halophila TaxID=516698 RepID=A0A918MX20_9ALTE|nr:DUF4168 domain-containing protein [Alteromonas halophila]GGW81170.1 hypothetical protein GCM10007391_12880 [Alteromonas halophila]